MSDEDSTWLNMIRHDSTWVYNGDSNMIKPWLNTIQTRLSMIKTWLDMVQTYFNMMKHDSTWLDRDMIQHESTRLDMIKRDWTWFNMM